LYPAWDASPPNTGRPVKAGIKFTFDIEETVLQKLSKVKVGLIVDSQRSVNFKTSKHSIDR
jgi:hypothetical protein